MIPFDTATYLSSSIGWSGTFITKKNKNPERAIKFIQWMFSPEGQALTQAGRRGIDYTQEPGQLPKFSDQWKAALADGSQIRVFNPWWYLGGSPTVEAESRVATTDPALVAEAYRVIRSKWGNSPWLAAAEPIGNSDEKIIMDKLAELVNTYEPRIIMADSEAEFESRFREFLANADQIGVGRLEAFMTNRVKQIKPQYR
jgi:putative aldouronate transport system substrate-binding protein